ncbi:hypothetical protein D082_14190 [Synechocystis sp. PCC 6714]|nr:hypothetical protein D082_14190 [Synechocystis sp. PCC 6714]
MLGVAVHLRQGPKAFTSGKIADTTLTKILPRRKYHLKRWPY